LPLSFFDLAGQAIETGQSEVPAEIIGLKTDRCGQKFDGLGRLAKLFEAVGKDTAIISRAKWIELHYFAHSLNTASSITCGNQDPSEGKLEN